MNIIISLHMACVNIVTSCYISYITLSGHNNVLFLLLLLINKSRAKLRVYRSGRASADCTIPQLIIPALTDHIKTTAKLPCTKTIDRLLKQRHSVSNHCLIILTNFSKAFALQARNYTVN